MARSAHYDQERILDAALQTASRTGPRAASIAALAAAIGAPTGSIYHRFRSRDLLMAELWLRTVERFQAGFLAALATPGGELVRTAYLALLRRAGAEQTDCRRSTAKELAP
ncbi:MAG: TetR family transcriptional regulator [Dehalococcoidia bacterium]